MRHLNIRRRLGNFLQTLFHRRTHTRSPAPPLIATNVRPNQSNSNTPYYTNDLDTPRAPSADLHYDPFVLPAPEIPVRALAQTRFIFFSLDGPASSNYHTRDSIDIDQRAPDSLEDLAQAPIVNSEVRLAGVMVETEYFALVVDRIAAIWDDFNAADAGEIPWGLVTREGEMSQGMRERPIGAGVRLREAHYERLRRAEERDRDY
ncbi:hypothetical protein MMC17_006193 [Xylographa soralifera]|nr:hypothetical protein [Xylographa soralifera]